MIKRLCRRLRCVLKNPTLGSNNIQCPLIKSVGFIWRPHGIIAGAQYLMKFDFHHMCHPKLSIFPFVSMNSCLIHWVMMFNTDTFHLPELMAGLFSLLMECATLEGWLNKYFKPVYLSKWCSPF